MLEVSDIQISLSKVLPSDGASKLDRGVESVEELGQERYNTASTGEDRQEQLYLGTAPDDTACRCG